MDVEGITEKLPDEHSVGMGTGIGLIVAGAIATALSVSRHRGGPMSWIVPGALLGGGAMILGSQVMQERSDKIYATEERIREDLDQLDPVARAKVMKDIAQEKLEPVLPD